MKSDNEVKEIREKMAKLQLQMQETPAFLPLTESLHYSQILRNDINNDDNKTLNLGKKILSLINLFSTKD